MELKTAEELIDPALEKRWSARRDERRVRGHPRVVGRFWAPVHGRLHRQRDRSRGVRPTTASGADLPRVRGPMPCRPARGSPRIPAIGTAVPTTTFDQETLVAIFGYSDLLRRNFLII